ncbi:MAG TPA: hypothetical protein DEQ38_07705 [Elusimicrobia bacterium]|nr:hypothetical protein [Elusimicrobiota bacterium]
MSASGYSPYTFSPEERILPFLVMSMRLEPLPLMPCSTTMLTLSEVPTSFISLISFSAHLPTRPISWLSLRSFLAFMNTMMVHSFVGIGWGLSGLMKSRMPLSACMARMSAALRELRLKSCAPAAEVPRTTAESTAENKVLFIMLIVYCLLLPPNRGGGPKT